jgi:hypothetical protein
MKNKKRKLIMSALFCFVSTEADNGEYGGQQKIKKANKLLDKLIKLDYSVQLSKEKKYCLEHCGKEI